MIRVFIDGSEGTTGLRIHSRLPARSDIELLTIDPEKRKDPSARRELLNSADIAFLCLPDAAAREAVAMVENPLTRILDTSTAHRTADGWAYGFPELTAAHRQAIASGSRIAVPGCHASGYLAIVRPLVEAGLLPAGAQLSCTSLTGYSGGGKRMIAEYEAANRPPALDAPRIYGLSQRHKHLAEMQAESRLCCPPVFFPIVGDFYSGMLARSVQEMENHRDDMVVIFAGYPDRMEEFLQKNPGLRSRIAYHVPFADYSVEELCSIAALTARKKGLHLDDQAQEKLASVFETARRQADFGNGRYVRNILEKAKMAQATRLLTQDYESLTQKEITTLCAEDIEMPEIAALARSRIGFSA